MLCLAWLYIVTCSTDVSLSAGGGGGKQGAVTPTGTCDPYWLSNLEQLV